MTDGNSESGAKLLKRDERYSSVTSSLVCSLPGSTFRRSKNI